MVGQLFRAAGMAAIASQFGGFTRIAAVLAAILVIAGRDAITSWMSAFFSFSHGFVGPPFPSHPFLYIGRFRVRNVSSRRYSTEL
ncbi:MAG: hypothetical protein ACLPWF_18540 [Bryobacteraceae bacterium]